MNGSNLKVPVSSTDHYMGPAFGPIVLVEYADYESPLSKSGMATMQNIFNQYRDHMCFVFRHFPEIKMYPNSALAAVAAEAAHLQGQFWEMHEAMMIFKGPLTTENIFEIGRQVGLDMKVFLDDLENEHLINIVKRDQDGAIMSGVLRAPTIFLNGFRYDGIPPVDKLQRLIESEIESRKASFFGQ